MTVDQRLVDIAGAQPYPLLFATISGAHLYGFASPDSDVDLRGVHILPVRLVIGLDVGPQTVQLAEMRDGIDLDLVTHDVFKFATLLLNRNGYVLEQLYSPLVVVSGADHVELKSIAAGCITRHHAHHYLGFGDTQWRLYQREHRLKPLLYTFRVLKTGIRLMLTGRIEADLNKLLDDEPRIAYLGELIAQKQTEGEHTMAPLDRDAVYLDDVDRLRAAVEDARDHSTLPESPTARAALNHFVVRVRETTREQGYR